MAIGNMLTAEETAEILGVDRGRVYQFARQGRIKGYRTANGWFFPKSEVTAFAKKPRKNGRPKNTSKTS